MPSQGNAAAISALSNLSIQYNFAVIAIALAFMDNNDDNQEAAYPRTLTQSSVLKSLVFAGAITGQLTMGLAGDVLGRRRAMLLTNSFSVVGALGTAFFTWGNPDTIYGIMGACRFILGVGVGGKYPLAAAMTKEAKQAPGANKPFEVAKGFFWQTPGAMLPYVVALILLAGFGKDHFGAEYMAATSFQFRFVLAVGAVPTIAATVLTYREADSAEFTAAHKGSGSGNPFRVAAAHPHLLRRLAGTGLSWFLYDFIYYGTSFNQVAITDDVFGSGDQLFDNCWQARPALPSHPAVDPCPSSPSLHDGSLSPLATPRRRTSRSRRWGCPASSSPFCG
jgi:PHS family inorganic phosphate transporter-like MFS transporter